MEKTKTLQKGWVVALLAMLCCFLWGSAFPSVKIGYQMFAIGAGDTAGQILFAGVRFTLAGILTVAIGSALSRKVLVPRRDSWGMVVNLALAQTIVQYLLFYIGMAHTSGVKGSILVATNVFITILLSALVFHYEKLTPNKALGCLLGFAGVVLINWNGTGLDSSLHLNGEGFVLLSAVSYAVSAVLMKQYSQRENPVTLSGWQFALGGVVMTAAGLAMGGRLQPSGGAAILLLVYMALISAVAYSIWGILLKHNPVSRVAVFGFMNPMFGVLLSALLLQEQNQAFTLQGLTALVLVCGGIYAVNRPGKVAQQQQ